MPKISLIVEHETGLHARPLTQFVQVAKQYDADIQVKNLTTDKGPVNGSSPIQLLLLAVLSGHQIEIEATGDQADEVLAALKELIESNFGEA